jgi:hypothetical protein
MSADDDRKRLVISEDDLFAEPAPPAAAPHVPPPPVEGGLWASAPAPPAPAGPAFPAVESRQPISVGGFGPPAPGPAQAPAWASAGGFGLDSVRGRNVVAAAAGIALGWAFVETTHFGLWQTFSPSRQNLNTGAFVAALGLIFAVVYAGWEHIRTPNLAGLRHVALRAAPWGAGLGFVSGFLANVVFRALLEDEFSESRIYLARMVAWGMFGMGMGAASAALIRSRQKLINGMVGGLVGGALGGVVFNWAGTQIESETFSRLIGLLFVGVGIGLAIGLVEVARREAWLHIVGGGMAGKEFILYDVETKVGSSPKCELTLIKEPAVQPYHIIISAAAPGGGGRTLTAYRDCAVTVNGEAVGQRRLRSGDVIGIGATSIAYSERAAAT